MRPGVMGGSRITGCLAIASVLLVAAMLTAAIAPELVDRSPLLTTLFAPVQMLWPWGPPVLIGWLFARMGSKSDPRRLTARVVSGIALALLLLFLCFMFAWTGRPVVPANEDAIIVAIVAAIAIGAGLYGFRGKAAEKR